MSQVSKQKENYQGNLSVFSFGICLQDSELLMCYDHDECPDDMPCVVGYCGEKQYFEAIGDIQCENDEVCKVCNSIMACC